MTKIKMTAAEHAEAYASHPEDTRQLECDFAHSWDKENRVVTFYAKPEQDERLSEIVLYLTGGMTFDPTAKNQDAALEQEKKRLCPLGDPDKVGPAEASRRLHMGCLERIATMEHRMARLRHRHRNADWNVAAEMDKLKQLLDATSEQAGYIEERVYANVNASR